MWKQARESGLSLAELLVVLAITVVLAAILLPAINTPNHAEGDPDANLAPYVVAAEGPMDSTRFRDKPSRDSDSTAPVVDDSVNSEPVPAVEVIPAFNTAEAETLERDGLKEFKTTDISYTLP